jgi:hypothetical protein
MPWYYAGPEAKPVGPLSVEELHARHVSGAVKPETYIIEQTGQSTETLAWKRYHEVFPTNLPPIPPPTTAAPVVPPVSTAPPPPVAQPHPLFPSAAPVQGQPHIIPTPGARPDPYYNVRPTNGWCGWGFGLGLTAFFFSFACGAGLIPALISLPLCVVGLAKVHKNRQQAGQGLAIAGLILATVALIVSLVFIISLSIPMLKAHGLTVTEQTTNDSE